MHTHQIPSAADWPGLGASRGVRARRGSRSAGRGHIGSSASLQRSVDCSSAHNTHTTTCTLGEARARPRRSSTAAAHASCACAFCAPFGRVPAACGPRDGRFVPSRAAARGCRRAAVGAAGAPSSAATVAAAAAELLGTAAHCQWLDTCESRTGDSNSRPAALPASAAGRTPTESVRRGGGRGLLRAGWPAAACGAGYKLLVLEHQAPSG
jgi:hypothetical protein